MKSSSWLNIFLLLQKRYLKKISFVIILLLVIPVILLFRLGAKEKSGMLTLALCMEREAKSGEAKTAEEIIKQLGETVSGINFIEFSDKEQALALLKQKKIDAVWTFDSDFDSRLQKAGQKGNILPLVNVYQGQDTVFLAYVREILCSKIFPYYSYLAYKNYVKERMPLVTEKDLLLQYSSYSNIPDLFRQESAGSQQLSDSYLMSPLRGMLALWLLMCAFAASLYFMQDVEQGSFVWFNKNSSFFFFLKITLIPMLDCALVMLAAIYAGGIGLSFGREVLSLLLLLLSSICFANLISLLSRKKHVFSALIPVIILLTLVLCPIFLKVNSFRALQFLLPVYYYLNSIYSLYHLILFVVYTVSLFLIMLIFYLLKDRVYNKFEV